MEWSYAREESKFQPIPEGVHRVRIKSATGKKSNAGNQMLEIILEVSGYNSSLYHRITFLPDRPEITNRMLTQFYDSFKDIPEGNTDMTGVWVGKVGACKVKHEEYNGDMQARVSYFVSADRQANLPAWKEPDNSSSNNSTTSNDGFMPANMSDQTLPF